MGKTYKDSNGVSHKSNEGKGRETKKGGGKQDQKKPQPKKEEVAKVRGAKPDFTPKQKTVVAQQYAGYDDRDNLFRPKMDNYIYEVRDLEFTKEYHPPFKDSKDLEIFVVCNSVPKDSQWERNGLRAGTRIKQSALWKNGYICNIDDNGVRAGVQTMYEFLRPAVPTFTIPHCESPVMLDLEPARPKVILVPPTEELPVEKDQARAARILWGEIPWKGLVMLGGVTFNLKELEKSGPVIYTHCAPAESGLLDAELKGKLFLSVGQLRTAPFYSRLTDADDLRIQRLVWEFLRCFMKKEGLIAEMEMAEKTAVTKAVKTTPTEDYADLAVLFDPSLKDNQKCLRWKVGDRRFIGVADSRIFGVVREVGKIGEISMNMLLSPVFYGEKESVQAEMYTYLHSAHFGEEKKVTRTPEPKAELVVLPPTIPNKITQDADKASSEMIRMFHGDQGLFKSVDENGCSAYFKSNGKVISFRGADNDHELGRLQQSGDLTFKTFVDMFELRNERPNLVGMAPGFARAMGILHAYLRKSGTKLGLRVKEQKPRSRNTAVAIPAGDKKLASALASRQLPVQEPQHAQ